MLQNLFGDIALDATIKSLIQKIGRFSFTPNSSLRVDCGGTSVAISSGTVTTVSTVSTMTTGNIGFGDNGKNGTSILMASSAFNSSVGKNFIRS